MKSYLYEKLSGREFLEFVADLHGLNRREAASRIAAQIAAFELADFVDDRSETYSHGMKQRLALAAALLHDPAVLVLDEPMVGLDPRSMRLVKNILQRRTAAGMIVFMSTHSLIAGRGDCRPDRRRRRRAADVSRHARRAARASGARPHVAGRTLSGVDRVGR